MSREYDYSVHYRVWHDDTDDHAKNMAAYHREQLRSLLPMPTRDKSILDIGCGMGFALLAFIELGFSEVHGIDVDREQIRICMQKKLPVELVGDTIQYLEHKKQEFDVISMLDVLEHFPVSEHIYLMRTVFNAIKPNGRVILTVPNANSILAARQRYIDFTHYCAFTEHSLRFVLLNSGFTDITIAGQQKMRRPSLRIWRRSVRSDLRKRLVRFLWREVLVAEVGHCEDVDKISMDLNLTAVAFKSNA